MGGEFGKSWYARRKGLVRKGPNTQPRLQKKSKRKAKSSSNVKKAADTKKLVKKLKRKGLLV